MNGHRRFDVTIKCWKNIARESTKQPEPFTVLFEFLVMTTSYDKTLHVTVDLPSYLDYGIPKQCFSPDKKIKGVHWTTKQ